MKYQDKKKYSIALDLQPLYSWHSARGIGRYTLNIVNKMVELDKQNDYYLVNFYGEIPAEWKIQGGDNVYALNMYDKAKPYLVERATSSSRHFFKETVAGIIETYDIDLYLMFTAVDQYEVYERDFFGNTKVANVVHDLIPIIFSREYLNTPYALKYADAVKSYLYDDFVFAVSMSAKKDLHEICGVAEDKICHTYEGSGLHALNKSYSESEKKEVFDKYGIKGEYLYCVGADDFRKNLDATAQAFLSQPKDILDRYQLVITCSISEDTVERLKEYDETENKDRIICTGFVDDQQLLLLLLNAKMMVFPSLYEGFGLPVVEAWECGIPVLTSNNSSLGEIAGEAAITVDPTSIQSIAEGITYALTEADLEKYIKAGHEKAHQFNWNDAAKVFIDHYEQIIEMPRKKIDKQEYAQLSARIEKICTEHLRKECLQSNNEPDLDALKRVVSAYELMSYADTEFVERVYKALLGRSPDEGGLKSHLGKLRAGELSKEEIIWGIHRSDEGRANGVEVSNLGRIMIKRKIKNGIKKIPGTKRVIRGMRNHTTMLRLGTAQQAKTNSMLDQIVQRLSIMEDRMSMAEQAHDGIHENMEALCDGVVDLKKGLSQAAQDYVSLNKRIDTIGLDASVVENIRNNLEQKYAELQDDVSNMTAYVAQCRDLILQRVDASIKTTNLSDEKLIAPINGIYSFCLNEALAKQGGFRESARYKYFKELHDILALYDLGQGEKIRIGREFDGGYVMAMPLSGRKIAYSFGISDDVSWDRKIAEYGYDVFQYDHTINGLPDHHPAFHWKKTGLTGEMETEELKHIETLLMENGHMDTDGLLLKMDIEGSEWKVFSHVTDDTLQLFDQIVMEVHDLTDTNHSDIVLEALRNLTKYHAPVHLHGNNYRSAVFSGDLITPDVLEITLVKKDKYNVKKSNVSLPEDIDQPNRSRTQDIWIGRW